MFNKLKQYEDIRGQAKDLQNQLSEESVTTSSNGISLTMDGNLKMTNLDIPADMLESSKKGKIEDAVKDAHDSAIKKIQRIMAMKMKEMGGMPNMPGMS